VKKVVAWKTPAANQYPRAPGDISRNLFMVNRRICRALRLAKISTQRIFALSAKDAATVQRAK